MGISASSPAYMSWKLVRTRMRMFLLVLAMSSPQQQMVIRTVTCMVPPMQFPSTPNGS